MGVRAKVEYEAEKERQRVEAAVRNEKFRRQTKQRNKESAVRQEFYETRLEAPLIEALGEEPVELAVEVEGGRVSLTFDQLQRLLDERLSEAERTARRLEG